MPSRGEVPGTSHPAHGRAGLLRAVFERARLRRRQLHGIRLDHARIGTCRFGPALAGVRAGRARNTGNPLLRITGATSALAAGSRIGEAYRLFCANRTWTRFGSWWDGNARQARW